MKTPHFAGLSKDKHDLPLDPARVRFTTTGSLEPSELVSGPLTVAARQKRLILDEATSALDPATEADICRRIKSLAGQTAILAISHRDAWQAIADEVYLLEQGRLERKGGDVGNKGDPLSSSRA